tara:strand:- start:1098 stop:1334 length:237 start_codon:yes stop_codon:yes gene_type:complete
MASSLSILHLSISAYPVIHFSGFHMRDQARDYWAGKDRAIRWRRAAPNALAYRAAYLVTLRFAAWMAAKTIILNSKIE